MATRYYLKKKVLTGINLPTTEQSSMVVAPNSVYGVSGSVPALRTLETSFPAYPSAADWFNDSAHAQNIDVAGPTGSYWGPWFRTAQFGSPATLVGGTVGLYHGFSHRVGGLGTDPLALLSQSVPVYHVYTWRPGVGKIATILDNVEGDRPVGNGTATVASQSFPYSGFSIQAGDMVVYEMWMTSSAKSAVTGWSGFLLYNFQWGGSGSNYTHLQPYPDGDSQSQNDPSSWIEFSENLPSFATSSLGASTVYIQNVRHHPTDPNKLRVTFSGQVSTSSFNAGAFSLSPYVEVKHAAFVPSTNNTQVDLHFGDDVPFKQNGLGHVLDANTIAHWGMEETAGTTIAATVGASPLTTVNSPSVQHGFIGNCREFVSTSTQYATGASTAGQKTALLGNISAEAWVNLRPRTSGNHTIIAHATNVSDETAAGNYLLDFFVLNTGKLYSFWENGAGVNQQAVQVAGGSVPFGRWTHIAMTRSASAGLVDTRFYIDGVLQDTILGQPAPSDGGSGVWILGRQGDGTDYVDGMVDDIRISDKARSDAEILESYTRGAPSHTASIAMWRFNETVGSTINDEGGKYPLVATSPSITTNGLFRGGRTFVANDLASGGSLIPRNIFLGEYTVNALFRWTGGNDYGQVVGYNGANTSPEAENYLMSLFVRSDGRVNWYVESGSAGTQVAFEGNTTRTIAAGQFSFVTLRKRRMSGTNGLPTARYAYELLVNNEPPVIFETYAPLNAFNGIPNVTGGTSVSTKFYVGRDAPGADDFVGTMDTIHIQRGLQPHLEHYEMLQRLFPLTRGTTYELTTNGLMDTLLNPIVDPSGSFLFQFLGENGPPESLDSDTFDASRVFGSSSFSVAGSPPRTGSILFGVTVDYDPEPPGVNIVRTPPVIQHFIPTEGSEIDKLTPIQFEVTDDSGEFTRVIISARFQKNLIKEFVHDGEFFGPKYTGSLNTRVPIENGYRYTMLRDGGWPEDPIVVPYAIDLTGSENL